MEMARPRRQSSNSSILKVVAEWGEYLGRLAGAVSQAITGSSRPTLSA